MPNFYSLTKKFSVSRILRICTRLTAYFLRANAFLQYDVSLTTAISSVTKKLLIGYNGYYFLKIMNLMGGTLL